MQKDKKFGLVVFKDTQNIGDDIQSYAAIKYLPKIDYYIEREKLNEFVSNDGEVVNTIMNGWFLHDITAMPPSPFVNPLFISIHFTDHLYNECPEYLDGYFVEYLKRYQPIGCRDELVTKYLTEKDVQNYWSGCLTLTIDSFKDVKREDYICAVDITDEELTYLKKVTNKEIRVLTHNVDDKINSSLSYEERMENVEKLLKTYQGASLVITSRLHCALPCLALETPVIMIHNNDNLDRKNRIGKFLDFITHVSSVEFLEGACDNLINNPVANNNKHLNMRKSLEKEVKDFVKNKTVEYIANEDLVDLYKKYFVIQKNYLTDVLKKAFDYKLKQIDKNNDLKELYWKEEFNKLEERCQNHIEKFEKQYQAQIYDLEREVNKYVLREEVLNKELEAAIENYTRIKDRTVEDCNRRIAELENRLNNIINSKGYRRLENFRRVKGRILRRR